MTCSTSGLQILVTLSRRYVMTSVMVSHINHMATSKHSSTQFLNAFLKVVLGSYNK